MAQCSWQDIAALCNLPEEREQEGSEVAMASAAKVSRVHAVLGALDAAAPIHAGVYNRIALGATQDHASVLSECRHALLPKRRVTIHV